MRESQSKKPIFVEQQKYLKLRYQIQKQAKFMNKIYFLKKSLGHGRKYNVCVYMYKTFF